MKRVKPPAGFARRSVLHLWVLLLLLLAGSLVTWGQGEESGSAEKELETFVPTEEVGIEQSVAFPVDI